MRRGHIPGPSSGSLDVQSSTWHPAAMRAMGCVLVVLHCSYLCRYLMFGRGSETFTTGCLHLTFLVDFLVWIVLRTCSAAQSQFTGWARCGSRLASDCNSRLAVDPDRKPCLILFRQTTHPSVTYHCDRLHGVLYLGSVACLLAAALDTLPK